MSVIGVISSLLGILVALLTLKTLFDRFLVAVDAPTSLNFYFLFFWAVVTSLLGGLMWAACQQIFPALMSTPCDAAHGVATMTLGGSREPHGVAAALWPVVTNFPALISLSILAKRYECIPLKGALLGTALLIAFLSLVSLAFYDLPLSGHRGVRCFIESGGLGYLDRELYLVIIWSALLSIIPFLGLFCAGKMGWVVGPAKSLIGSSAAAAVTMVLTISSVGFFLAAYPDQSFETARGVVAGLALRVSLFFGFIVSCNPLHVRGIPFTLGTRHD